MPLTPGTRFAHYDIVSAAGSGGMGEVFRARDAYLANHQETRTTMFVAEGLR